ncbi:glycoside hydrolase family 28 protein [Mucilaginibacter sabulilitoris]|uniref:Glycoside hydrolase family 28 protein n=1 Tax=Mucilaginibacter sabulilitoris TaxID=1173583 RepID=A0ABZ0THW6_9SPHI|nr:glycoside hydrolase family 28 protein [Mucilaginibacter sabulilitoris]WPU92401.1 glycoside hydrolase family 28 protein [Mucilaginibacter sabulilitoris]
MSVKGSFGIVALLVAGALSASAQVSPYSWKNLPRVSMPVFKKDTFNILKYGAKPDGLTLNTGSINKAIADCSAKGGGVVLIPQGLWLTGPVVMKSNVNLHVNRAALLQFTDDKSQYKLVEGNYEGHVAVRNESPISGINLTNIAITGDGIIDGHGEVWRAISKERLTEAEWKKLVASGGIVSENGKTWYPSASYVKGLQTPGAGILGRGKTLADNEPMKDFFRPNMLVLTNCKKVLLQGVTLQNSAAWDIHTLLCEDLNVQNVRVRNNWNAQNGDGIDVESCKNVLIEGSTFDAGDDGICIKSGRDEEGRKRGKPTENVVVRNNVVYRAHGGFVIGSEMSGGARNIFVYDCTFIGTDIGLRFKTTRGRGGVVENIFIKNISMRAILHEAILFDMYYGGKSPGEDDVVKDEATIPVTEATPSFRNFYVNNVACNGAEKALMIRGLPEMSIKGIHIENSTFQTDKGADIIEGQDVSLKNVYLQSKDSNPLINIQNGSNIMFDHVTYKNAELLFKISGKKSAGIKLLNTDTSKAKNKAVFGAGVANNVLVVK